MTALTDLETLIRDANPGLAEGHYVFASFPGARYGDLASLMPLAVIGEQEGLTMVLKQEVAAAAGITSGQTFRLISLQVHSALHAVGLTAAVSACLAQHGIPANMLAGYYHDHVLVPSDQAEQALQAIRDMASE